GTTGSRQGGPEPPGRGRPPRLGAASRRARRGRSGTSPRGPGSRARPPPESSRPGSSPRRGGDRPRRRDRLVGVSRLVEAAPAGGHEPGEVAGPLPARALLVDVGRGADPAL